MQDESDQALLDRARSGDAAALEQLLERHQAQVYRFGMKMCGDPEDAQDVLQETLLARRGLPPLQDPSDKRLGVEQATVRRLASAHGAFTKGRPASQRP